MANIIDISLIFYAALIVGMWAIAIIVRLLAERNRLNERSLNWLQGFSRLRKIFGWTALGLFVISQMIVLPVLLVGSTTNQSDGAFALEFSSLLIFMSSFYLGALWLMVGGSQISKPQTLGTDESQVAFSLKAGKVDYSELERKYSVADIEAESKRAKKIILWVFLIILPLSFGVGVLMTRYGFHESWSFSFAFSTFLL